MILSSEIKQFVKEHESENIHELMLKARKYPAINMDIAINQIKGRQIAKEKIPSWYGNDGIVYPKQLSMEQCSSEQTALYKMNLYKGDSLVDLTGGFGVDFAFLAAQFKQAIYVEQQEELCKIAEHNFKELGLKNAEVINNNSVHYLENMSQVDLIYIDPARRDSSGKKTVLIEDCAPNILELENLLVQKAKRIVIKLSPMLDISLALRSLKEVAEVHIISYQNECKELLLVKIPDTDQNTIFKCIHIQNGKTDQLSFSREEEADLSINYATILKKYLYEPNSSIIKAGAYKTVVKQFCVDKLHPNSHLYTSEQLIEDFQGRKFEIEKISTLNKKELKDNLGAIKQANITTRNFPLSVDELRKKIGIKEGGEKYIFATTLADNNKVLIICKKC